MARTVTETMGSSPLTRGKPHSDSHATVKRGLIPAHAGKTVTASSRACQSAAHPRSRGENPGRPLIHETAVGSSPLTRGKRATVYRRVAGPRLIPAHAGKTKRRSAPRSSPWAHPRSRGENAKSALGNLGNTGSSPLTRGKRGNGCDHEEDRRLIPAHAGKTTGRMCRSTCSTAHPRSRGENSVTWG